MFLAGPKVKNPLASKLAAGSRPFDPGIIIIIGKEIWKINHLFYGFF